MLGASGEQGGHAHVLRIGRQQPWQYLERLKSGTRPNTWCFVAHVTLDLYSMGALVHATGIQTLGNVLV